ncbi:Conserved hypothetical protein CHP00245 [Alkalidesulfovibrio alkalitolerans DSM 16529]|jgi:putative ABC transport system permease protein|uniref:Iron export ABC transporter permease subunit FetB n=1 Tax=Alkalidesulfovibrio alkalitolerans DSM 16529 TaxID=1121439 RepID=S7UUR2_9BACT|nr:iron export ABC transporter permease subunit FetB [Alkalidesulfovibrio alkalitolerans]EPR36098.1 Conserved hypothetical protein CHP00245 [Alkalidesulfovibrio alkalitolerans DSM 16529]
MNAMPAEIGPLQLSLGLVFVLLGLWGSRRYDLGIGRDLVVGTVRTFAQLLLMGWLLVYIFQAQMLVVVLGVFVVMVATAAHIVRGRVKDRQVAVGLPVFASMFLSYLVVSVMVTGVIVQASPWWRAEYFIPLAGMVIGNSMSALALALERLLSELRDKRERVEMLLSLGASPAEASRDAVRAALRAGIMPSINSMMGVGIVFIPGMMTGQILAGADPRDAISYQIVVMLMLVGSTVLGSLFTVLWVRRSCFGPGGALVLRPPTA